MTLHNHVTSLEISKTMKEMGFPQTSHYSWIEASDGARLLRNPIASTYRYFEQCSAYLSSEVGEMLPNSLGVPFEVYKDDNNRFAISDKEYGLFSANTEVDSKAKMAIYLKTQGLI